MLVSIRMGTNTAAGNQQKHLSLSLLQTREFISRGTQKIILLYFFQYKNCSDSQIPRNKSRNKSLFNQHGPSCKCRVTQKLTSSTSVYHKTKNLFRTKLCMNINFQLLLSIIKIQIGPAARALIGQKPMFYQSIKHRKSVFCCFARVKSIY